MKERIQHLMESERMTATRFADFIGVQPSSISHIINGRNKPSAEFLQKLLKKFPHLNAEWLILGTGTMYKTTASSPSVKNKEVIQPSLFDDLTDDSDSGFSLDEFTLDSFPNDKAEVEEERREAKQNESLQVSNSRKELKIEKIVVFYTDNSFKEYIPR